jgi:hypothetical protein
VACSGSRETIATPSLGVSADDLLQEVDADVERRQLGVE